MAWLDLPPSGVFQVGFRYAGRKWKRSLDTTNPQLAERARLRVEERQGLDQRRVHGEQRIEQVGQPNAIGF